MVGFNRPYYRLDHDMRVAGRFDLKFDGILSGISNTMILTVSYDLRRTDQQPASMGLSIENMVFKIALPIGNR